MANTYTTRFNMTKPEVGADTNAWGGHLNSNLDTIDLNMVSKEVATAQTMSGALNLPSNGLNVGSGQLQVTGGNVSASGNFSAVNGSFSGTFGATGAATLSSTLGVTGAATLSSTLAVTGAATFSSTMSVTGAVTASTAPTVGGHLTNKTYVDNADALKLNLSGGTMTGNLTIQNTAPSIVMADTDNGTFQVHCNSALIGFLGTGGNWISRTDNSGNFVATGNVTAYSDARLKENVETIHNALDLVHQMRGVFYDRIDTGEPGVGVIAQEIEEVLPEVVVHSDGMLSVAYGNLVGVLIEAIKELSARVEKLEAR